MKIRCSDCGDSRNATRLINGDVLCRVCEVQRAEHIYTITSPEPSKHIFSDDAIDEMED